MSTTTPLLVQSRELLEDLAGLPLDARREAAFRAYLDRRAELALYATAHAERFGDRPDVAHLEADDDLLAELLVLAIA